MSLSRRYAPHTYPGSVRAASMSERQSTLSNLVVVSVLSALAVLVFYWGHRLLVDEPAITQNGVSITIFLAVFVAVYSLLRLF